MKRRRTISCLGLGLLSAALVLVTATPALADVVAPPKSVTPVPTITVAPSTSAPGDVPAPAAADDDGHAGTLVVAGAVVVLVAGVSVVALRRTSKATADSDGSTASGDDPSTDEPPGREGDS